MSEWALFKDGEQISKPHSTRNAAIIEAYEKKVVVTYSADWVGDTSGTELIGGFTVEEIRP